VKKRLASTTLRCTSWLASPLAISVEVATWHGLMMYDVVASRQK
jgi:hypothetical protein